MTDMNDEVAQKEADALLEQLSKNRGTFQSPTSAQKPTIPAFSGFSNDTKASRGRWDRQHILFASLIVTFLFTTAFFLFGQSSGTSRVSEETIRRAMK